MSDYAVVTDDHACPNCEKVITGTHTVYECSIHSDGCGERFCTKCAKKTGDPKTTMCPKCGEVWRIQSVPRDNEAILGGNHTKLIREQDQ